MSDGHVHQHQTIPPGNGALILRREPLAPNLQLLTVHAPAVAAKIQPGQFVIVMADATGERIPLTVADWDRETGAVSCVFMQVGRSTYKLGEMEPGQELAAFVGPLGHALDLNVDGTVVVAGGCYGIGSIYPVARAFKERGNRVLAVVEARSKFLFYWLDRLEAVSDRVFCSTKDRSLGKPGYCPGLIREILQSGEAVARVIAIGCTFMMYEVSQSTREAGVETIVSLNPIMIDGTGMCGACRVSVGGQTRFACVDGPDFDGHQVDWDLLLARRKAYLGPETVAAER
jgi:ferredoxin--NADP+ reductase